MHEPQRTLTIALVGLPGAGKSSIAPLLAERLGGSCADLDALIERSSAMTIRELFATRGEAAFRELEAAEVARAVAAGVRVVACGGGIVETASARQLLRERCHTVWLEVDVLEALRRMSGALGERPLLGAAAEPARLEELLARRAVAYAEVAQLRVRTDGLSPEAVADRIASELEHVVKRELELERELERERERERQGEREPKEKTS